MVANHEKLYVFVGSYAESENSGVYVYSLDEGGQLTLQDEITGFKNPTFVNVDPNQHKAYVIAETKSAEGSKRSEVATLLIDPATGALKLNNRKNSVESSTCHIQRDPSNQSLIVTSYHGGMVGLHAIAEDGSAGELLDVKQHEGHSVDPNNQDKPHPHSSFFSPDGKYLFVQDLGLDIIQAYSMDSNKQQLIKQGTTNLHPGAGPRHLTFHPQGSYAFVINELNSTITSFEYNAENGELKERETVPTLPQDFTGDNGCAEITISQDGKYVYGSNRGHDSIVVYAFDEVTGKLTYVEHVSVEGEHPRHFALTPKGDYLIVANRDTNNLTTFRVDQESGRLEYTGISVTVSKPVCVQPYYL